MSQTLTWGNVGAWMKFCAEETTYNVAVELLSDTSFRVVVAFYDSDFYAGISPSNGDEDVPASSNVFRVRYRIDTHTSLGTTEGSEEVAELEWDETPDDPGSRNGVSSTCVACFQSELLAKPADELGDPETLSDDVTYTVELVDELVIFSSCPCTGSGAVL